LHGGGGGHLTSSAAAAVYGRAEKRTVNFRARVRFNGDEEIVITYEWPGKFSRALSVGSQHGGAVVPTLGAIPTYLYVDILVTGGDLGKLR